MASSLSPRRRCPMEGIHDPFSNAERYSPSASAYRLVARHVVFHVYDARPGGMPPEERSGCSTRL
jgi:hypothetical protein